MTDDGYMNAIDSEGRTALHHVLDRDDPAMFAHFGEWQKQQEPASVECRLDIATALIQAKADVNTVGSSNRTALHHACERPLQPPPPPAGSDLSAPAPPVDDPSIKSDESTAASHSRVLAALLAANADVKPRTSLRTLRSAALSGPFRRARRARRARAVAPLLAPTRNFPPKSARRRTNSAR
jgi:hypothetical protein